MYLELCDITITRYVEIAFQVELKYEIIVCVYSTRYIGNCTPLCFIKSQQAMEKVKNGFKRNIILFGSE